MNDFASDSHPPSHRHISHHISLKLHRLVCSHLSCFFNETSVQNVNIDEERRPKSMF